MEFARAINHQYKQAHELNDLQDEDSAAIDCQ